MPPPDSRCMAAISPPLAKKASTLPSSSARIWQL
jgi:hypothetical protein